MVSIESLKPGDRVLVKVGKNLISCAVVGTGGGRAVVKSESTGREFRAAKIEGLVARAADAAKPPCGEKPKDEPPRVEMPKDEPPGADAAKCEAPQPPAHAAKAEKPRRRLSLVGAGIEVLRQEGRPLNTREIVRLAVERGLWTPTACRTPEQSLYGAFFLEIRNSDSPRVRKSSERGRFELS